ncbi:hypothetical protein NMY22_g13675 [Coprinellus aureogranulatus]|nr:hypothetical protein NMY22_g13675 [Coprinellus aureogranulatus]
MFALLAGLEQAIQNRFSHLPNYAHLPLQAAAIACEIEQPGRAVEWLEQGRCLIWTQLNNLRTPLDNLEKQDGELARQIRDLATQLENTGSSQSASNADMAMTEKITQEDDARVRLDLSERWDHLLTTAREIPGFEHFLQPPPCSTLLNSIPESGYVVVINVDQKRCDAIALRSGLDAPVHVPLTNFSLDKANKYRVSLMGQLSGHGLRLRKEEPVEDTELYRPAVFGRRKANPGDLLIGDVLRGLWNEVVKPILDAIGLYNADPACPTGLPRIWWCPTGPLSFLPLHAAGDYGGSKTESILDYAVSSYTPTVTALIERVNSSQLADGKISGLFLTSQPNAIPTSIISGTTKEIHSIDSLAKKHGVRAVSVEGDDVGLDEFTGYMEQFSSIHLACHASQNTKEPLKSRFQFHKGSLELETIIKRDIKGADLAFLSACQTSTGDEKLSDEAVHLAAGMLAAGYRRVVATMWAIGDRHAPDIAHDFYEYLWSNREEGAGEGFDASLSAHALHYAIQQLRERLGDDSERSLLAWVPYVHFGY